jgi:hypothetical protein
MKVSEIYEKYGKQRLPFHECWFCENIEDCPHPDADFKGSPICPDECVRRDEIILIKKSL